MDSSYSIEMKRPTAFVGAVLLLLGLVGCSSTKRTERSETPSVAEEWAQYEAELRPAEHDPGLGAIFSKVRKEQGASDSSTVGGPGSETPVLVSGFRVQLYATTNVDEINARKVDAEAAFPDVRFYVVYDPPTYKLRAGNFLSRPEAEAFALRMQANGYPDAWVVPDRVLKDAAPR
ncbi:MAG TPA: SPOR domain-containing protein [Bacteroidota bacterium]|nr:SPOR domain-containing protein [Bacteroidota bacterium]